MTAGTEGLGKGTVDPEIVYRVFIRYLMHYMNMLRSADRLVGGSRAL